MKRFSLLPLTLVLFSLLIACNNEKTAEAKKITDIPTTTTSEEAKAAFTQALALYDQGDFQPSRPLFAKAVELDPSFALGHIFKCLTSLSPKDFADELNLAKAHLDSASEWEKLSYEYYATYLDNNWNKRLEVAQKIAAAYPDAARAQLDLGNAYLNGNQDAKARECYQKAVELGPNWPASYYALSNSYLFSDPKDYKKAEELAMKMIELAPKSAASEVALGDAYRAQNNLEKARDAYSKAIELDPASSGSYYKKGHANSYLGNFDEARKDFTEAVKHDDTKFNAYTFIANTYLYEGNTKAGLQYLMEKLAGMDSSTESKDRISNGKYNLIDACANIAMHTGDAATLKKLIPMMESVYMEVAGDVGTPEAKLVERGSILYWQAMIAAIEGQYDAAKAKAEEMKTTLDPITDPTKLSGYYFVHGYISMKQKNYADAISQFDKTNPVFMYNKYAQATANEAAGNKDKANALYKEIATYNFNEVGYALIRNDAKKKAGLP